MKTNCLHTYRLNRTTKFITVQCSIPEGRPLAVAELTPYRLVKALRATWTSEVDTLPAGSIILLAAGLAGELAAAGGIEPLAEVLWVDHKAEHEARLAEKRRSIDYAAQWASRKAARAARERQALREESLALGEATRARIADRGNPPG